MTPVATTRDDDARDREPPAERPRRPRPRQTGSKASAPRDDRAEKDREPQRVRREPEGEEDRRGSADGGRSLKAAQAAQLAVRQVHELTGRQPESVTSLERVENGWRVSVEVVESHRVPDTADILAVYEAELDQDGDLLSYRRVDRYSRGRGDER
ncbi:gas vesicle protein [Saccharopolyspora elongata]|uniref:Gas vesicle protein n=1 Tax=Saccharopolyspora elongata TaxID=2530387 RepID=A0A4V2YMD5_9PSEU|nr:gas vesicle protein [Saccharopolyspora elongata]